eukprot:Rhum_TRINITY_DN15272_c6_g1::Rhum_TRINITY_DN15272_c6_g1_i1::g.148298::m.148298
MTGGRGGGSGSVGLVSAVFAAASVLVGRAAGQQAFEVPGVELKHSSTSWSGRYTLLGGGTQLLLLDNNDIGNVSLLCDCHAILGYKNDLTQCKPHSVVVDPTRPYAYVAYEVGMFGEACVGVLVLPPEKTTPFCAAENNPRFFCSGAQTLDDPKITFSALDNLLVFYDGLNVGSGGPAWVFNVTDPTQVISVAPMKTGFPSFKSAFVRGTKLCGLTSTSIQAKAVKSGASFLTDVGALNGLTGALTMDRRRYPASASTVEAFALFNAAPELRLISFAADDPQVSVTSDTAAAQALCSARNLPILYTLDIAKGIRAYDTTDPQAGLQSYWTYSSTDLGITGPADTVRGLYHYTRMRILVSVATGSGRTRIMYTNGAGAETKFAPPPLSGCFEVTFGGIPNVRGKYLFDKNTTNGTSFSHTDGSGMLIQVSSSREEWEIVDAASSKSVVWENCERTSLTVPVSGCCTLLPKGDCPTVATCDDTRAPSTDAPPTDAPPTDVPPTDSPTDAPPTDAPPTDAPPTDAPPTDAPPTEAPPTEAPPTDTPPLANVTEEEEPTKAPPPLPKEVKTTAAVGSGVAVISAFVGGPGTGAGLSKILTLARGVQCAESDDDPLPFIMHPTTFTLSGSHWAGAVVGNSALILVLPLLLLACFHLIYTFKTRSIEDASVRDLQRALKNNSSRESVSSQYYTQEQLGRFKAASYIRYPSLVLPFQMLLMPSILECSLHLLLNSTDSNIPYGVLGVLTNILFIAYLAYVARTDHTQAELLRPKVPPATPLKKVMAFFFGGAAWANTPEGEPYYCERMGVFFDTYSYLPRLSGHYFLVEYAHVVPLSYLAALPLTGQGKCIFKTASMGSVLALQAGLLVWRTGYISAFLQHLTVVTCVVGSASMFASTISFAAHDTFETKWGDASLILLQTMIYLTMLRGVYDILLFILDLVVGYRRGIVSAKQAERKVEAEERGDDDSSPRMLAPSTAFGSLGLLNVDEFNKATPVSPSLLQVSEPPSDPEFGSPLYALRAPLSFRYKRTSSATELTQMVHADTSRSSRSEREPEDSSDDGNIFVL